MPPPGSEPPPGSVFIPADDPTPTDAMGGPPMGPEGMMGPPGGGGPPMLPGMAPEPPPEPPKNPFAELLAILRMVVEQQGEEMASELLHLLPPETLSVLINAVDADPEDMAFIESLLPDDPNPVYPAWFKIPPKPTVEEAKELVTRDAAEWDPVRQRIDEDLRLYNQEIMAVDDSFDKDEDKPFLSPAMSDEARTIAALLGGIAPMYQVPWTDPKLEDATQQCEDALYYWDQVHHLNHLERGNNPYQTDVATSLVTTGYAMAAIMFDPTNPDDPFPEFLVSPATTVPTWDAKGLARVTRRYLSTVREVIGEWGGADPKKLEKKLLAAYKPSKTSERELYRLDDQGVVQVYQDRWWTAVYFDDEVVLPPTAHRYGFCPYVIQGSGAGESMAITHILSDDQAATRGVTNARLRIDKKHPSYFYFRKRFHAQKEQTLGILRTVFSYVADPAMILEQDDFAAVNEDVEIHREPGGITKLSNHERLYPFIENPQHLGAFGPLMQSLMSDELSNKLPPGLGGISEAANQSGNAAEGLYEMGKDKIASYFVAMESFYAQRATLRLRMFRDWGHMMQDVDGESGHLTVPYQRGRIRSNSRPPGFELTPKTIKRAGYRVQCSLRHLRMQNLAPLGNAGAIWIQQGAMTRRELMEMRGVRDPDAIATELRYENALMDEEVQKALAYSEMVDRDPVAAEFLRQLVYAKAAPPGPPGMGGPPDAQTFRGPNTSGMNLQALGMGQEGPTGRPGGPPDEPTYGAPPPPPPGSYAI